ncbi:hypothetical protein C7212DRAFT_358494 [Tuber magnatum]|uniref:Uncharacterized protein n=1 Tax=Tuber magnatum TaxID=42249 RepID=A0A317SP29_9PEZI|nr:hypothetical protein C7212DRAFT_358494 [Tuber magnatum]
MVSCYAEEAGDIIENVERCRGLMLSSKRGGVPHISAVSGLLVNPEISQSQREKEEELQKRRGYVLDAVNSPAAVEAMSSGQSESGEILSINAADLEDTCGGASSPIIRRSARADLQPGAKASTQALRPPSTGTHPKQVREAPHDCSPLSSPPTSEDIPGSRQARPSDLRDHPAAQTSGSKHFTKTECALVESAGSRGLGDNKLSQVNGEPTDGLSKPTRPAKTTKSVSRKAGGERTAKNIKPLVQRKKPEPLPISDDIWELPLSSPVSQGPKAGGTAQKHSASINQKAKHVPKPAGIVRGRFVAKVKAVPGNRGRGKGRSYKSEAQVVDSSEESTPHSGSEPVGPGVLRTPCEMETEKFALTPQPKTPTETAQPAQTSEEQPNLRRSLRERKPPKVVLIPSSDGESERGELVECTPRKAPARLLSPGKKPGSVTTNKRVLPEAYSNAPMKKRKDAPIRESVDVLQASNTGRRGVRRGARVVQLGKEQENAGGTRLVAGKISPAAPEHVQDRETTPVSSKRKAHKPTITPKELAEGSHKRQRTSPTKTGGRDERGARAPTFEASSGPEAVISLSQMDGSLGAPDSICGGPGLDGRVADNDDALPPLSRREYINHKEGREVGGASNISSPMEPPEPSAHDPQIAQEVLGSLDDASRRAPTHGQGSQKYHHSSLECFPREPLPPEALGNPARRLSSADILGTSSPSGSSAALHYVQENLQRNSPIASVNASKALTPRPTSNRVDASTCTADLNEDRITSTSRSRTSGPSPRAAEENGSTILKQIPGVTSPMAQLKGKVTCDRAVSANAVSEAAINESHLLSPIEFSKAGSPAGPMLRDAARNGGRSRPNGPVQLFTTQRLQSLVILSEGDEDIVVWDAKEKGGGFKALRRTETGHTEVDENGSPSRLDAPKPHTRPKEISWEILSRRKDYTPEHSPEPETEENMFAENSHGIFVGRTSLDRQPSSEQTHHIVRTRAKGGRPENSKISTDDEGGWRHFKHKDGATRGTDGPKNRSMELPKPLEKFREVAKDVISISSTSPSPVLPLSIPPKKSPRICPEPEPWEDSDGTEPTEPAVAKILQILAKRGANIPKLSPPALRHSKPKKVQLIRSGRRELEDNDGLVRSAGVEATNTEDRPFEDAALAKKGHLGTHFSKMLRKQQFVRIQRPPYRGDRPDPQLTEERFRRTSGMAPIKGERVRGQEWIQDSDHDGLDSATGEEDSVGTYTDKNGPDRNIDTCSDSESGESGDSEDGDQNGQEGEEDAHTAWRKSLPGHLKGTLSALEQITRGLVKYLVCSEELAVELIEGFEAQGARLIQSLDDSHAQEYEEFLDNLEEARKAVAAKAGELDQVIRNGLDSVERKEKDWENSRMARKKQHQKLDDEVEEMLMDTNN